MRPYKKLQTTALGIVSYHKSGTLQKFLLVWRRWTGYRQRRQVRQLWRWSTVGVVATTTAASGFRITAAARFFVAFHQLDRILSGIVTVGSDEVVIAVHRVVLLLFALLGLPLGIRGVPSLKKVNKNPD